MRHPSLVCWRMRVEELHGTCSWPILLGETFYSRRDEFDSTIMQTYCAENRLRVRTLFLKLLLFVRSAVEFVFYEYFYSHAQRS
jgi:hypothetical protein